MASFNQVRNICALAAVVNLVATSCIKEHESVANSAAPDLSKLKLPERSLVTETNAMPGSGVDYSAIATR